MQLKLSKCDFLKTVIGLIGILNTMLDYKCYIKNTMLKNKLSFITDIFLSFFTLVLLFITAIDIIIIGLFIE
jgi:hypothetical protein